jgi:hypothetical protein
MKTSKLLTMLALPLAFAACTNDEFIANVETPATGEVLSIGEDFALMVARDADEANTRADYHIVTEEDGSKMMRFFWMPKMAVNNVLGSDRIGLGWLNVNPDGKIYTNYEFVHKAWPKHDKTSEYQCDKWTDAYSWDSNIADGRVTIASGQLTSPEDYALSNGSGDADLHRGLFMTDNKSIMGGKYIVYYPYDETIIENGYVKATSKREFSGFTAAANAEYEDYLKGLANETFYISSEPVELKGGVTANEFRMQAVSGIIRVKLNTNLVSAANADNFKDINKIALYSENGFITEVELDASKIGSATGEGLYVAGTEKRVNTLVASYDAINLEEDVLNFCIPALPTTAKNVKVIIYRNSTSPSAFEGSVVINTNQNLTVRPGQITNLSLTLTDAAAPVKDQIAVVDEASLRTAVNKAKDGATIILLDDIKLTESLELNGDDALTLTGGDIIIPASTGSAIELKLGKADNSNNDAKKVTVNSRIFVEERGCCNKEAGLLTVLNNVTLNGTVNNKGQVVFGNGTNFVKGIELNGVINNVTTEFLDEKEAKTYATITVEAKTEANINNAMNIGQDTKLLVNAQDGTSASGDDGTLYITNGKTLTNNGDILVKGNITNNNGAFVNNSIVTETVGAQITGKQITEQSDAAQYICEVNSVSRFDDAVNKDSHFHVTMVRFKDGVDAYTLKDDYKNGNGDWIDFESDLTSTKLLTLNHKINTATTKPYPSHIGELSVKNGGLVINHGDLTMEDFTVDHQVQTNRGMIINKKIKVVHDVNIKKFNNSINADIDLKEGIEVGGNMTVTDSGANSVAFAKEAESDITGNMRVEKDGEMEFQAMSITNIKGANGFANDGKVTIVTATSGTEFPARVYSRSYTNGGDKTKWINGSEPIIKANW